MKNTTWAVVEPSKYFKGETSLVCWVYGGEKAAQDKADRMNAEHNTDRYTIEEVERFDTI